MRFRACDIERLVRPKTLTHLLLWDKKTNIDVWWKSVSGNSRWTQKSRVKFLTDFYKCNLPTLFFDLSLTDINKEPEKSYIGQITSFVVLHKGLAYLIESEENANIFHKNIEKFYGKDSYLPIIAVGIKFYKSVNKTKDRYEPQDAWKHTDLNSPVWFYRPSDIVTIENIVKYEKQNLGDYVKLKKVHGLILKETHTDKSKFYQKNSATTKTLFVLSPQLVYVRIQINRKI